VKALEILAGIVVLWGSAVLIASAVGTVLMVFGFWGTLVAAWVAWCWYDSRPVR